MTINDINDESNEGKLLIAAIAKITTESQTDKTPDQVLGQLIELANHITPNSVVLHPERITAEWLCNIHPELNIARAGDLKRFCTEKTIVNKECYGDGSIMYPKWKEEVGL